MPIKTCVFLIAPYLARSGWHRSLLRMYLTGPLDGRKKPHFSDGYEIRTLRPSWKQRWKLEEYAPSCSNTNHIIKIYNCATTLLGMVFQLVERHQERNSCLMVTNCVDINPVVSDRQQLLRGILGLILRAVRLWNNESPLRVAKSLAYLQVAISKDWDNPNLE